MLCPLPAGQRRARSGLSRSAHSTFRDINCRNARLCAARASKTSGSTSSRFPARRASNNAIERRYRAPVPLNPIGDNLSDVAACTRAQKGRHSGNPGLFRPRYEQEADEMKRDLRVLATASALLLPMGTASAQSKAGSSKSAILTVQRACRCSRNRRS